MSTKDEVCSAIRNLKRLSHEDLCTVLACLSAAVQKSSCYLSDSCAKGTVDALDEIAGQVEDDQINQDSFEDMPGFGGTYAQLDALTLYREAA